MKKVLFISIIFSLIFSSFIVAGAKEKEITDEELFALQNEMFSKVDEMRRMELLIKKLKSI